MSQNFSSQRIVKNSTLLYVRMLFTMWLNLYATRLVLTNLGIEDMGVYGVVGSIVSLISIFTNGITNAVQRFITFELGDEDGQPNKVFCSSLNVIFVLSLIVIILLETIGLWILYNKVNIPPTSTNAAFWVYQFSILTCIVNLISIPYNALVIAHEKMDAFAAISILQVILNFAAAYFISYFDQRLLTYGILMAIASVVIRLIYQLYCHLQFKESHFHFIIDTSLLRGITKFAGISTISGGLQTLSSQGIILVINWTFGVSLNAVYTIALQLKNSVLSFAFNIFKAISPQITKTYANGEIDNHKQLVYGGSKAEAYMIYFIMIPFLFKTDYIMELWLGEVPQYAIEFTQSIIFLSLTYAIFEPIRFSVYATNKIAKFMLYPEVFYLFVLPFGYIISKLTESPIMLIVTIVAMDIITCIIRTIFAVKVTPLTIREIIKNTIIPSLLVAMIASIACYFLSQTISNNIIGLIVLLVINSLILCGIIWIVGLNKAERRVCYSLIRKIRK